MSLQLSPQLPSINTVIVITLQSHHASKWKKHMPKVIQQYEKEIRVQDLKAHTKTHGNHDIYFHDSYSRSQAENIIQST